jgi:uncharacterized protein (TIGR03000 family)
MFQKALSIAGTLLIAGTAVLMTPGFSQARGGGGGGHGGGGHGGGGHGGGGHFSGGGHFGSGGWNGGYRGGYVGQRSGSYGRGYGYHRYGGYYPFYGYYGGSYPYYDNYSYPSYSSGYYDPYGDVAPDYDYSTPAPATGAQASYSSSTAAVQPDTTAHVTVRVPADAKVTLNGTPTASTGMVRQFVSPPLASGRYAYDVEARWNEGGKEVTQTRQVAIAPGAHVEVAFPTQPQTEKK